MNKYEVNKRFGYQQIVPGMYWKSKIKASNIWEYEFDKLKREILQELDGHEFEGDYIIRVDISPFKWSDDS